MNNYVNLLKKILDSGTYSEDRTGTGTRSLFSETLKFDLSDGFPLVTTKLVNYKAVLNELLWFITGSDNINDLDSKIWNKWAAENGSIGPMYGYQWRNWGGIDQLQDVISNIKTNPYSRRHIVSAWNVADLPNESFSPIVNVDCGFMALAPCHKDFQFYIRNNTINLHWNQRSVDVFLGLPFNIASYATLLQMVGILTDLTPGILSFHGVDVHLYLNHLDQVRKQVERIPLKLSKLHIKKRNSIDDFEFNDFELKEYEHYSKLVGKISI